MESVAETERSVRAWVHGIYRDQLTNLFLDFYREKPKFAERLWDIAQEYRDAIPETQEPWGSRFLPLRWEELEGVAAYGGSSRLLAFMDKIKRFTDRWGLSCLPGDEGYDRVMSGARELEGTPFGTRPFLIIGKMHEIPTLEGQIPDPRRTALKVSFEDAWPFELESLDDAVQRIETHFHQWVRDELRRLKMVAEQGGYRFPGEPTERQKHLCWLFRRVAYRDAAWKIANEESVSEGTVNNRTQEYKNLLGIKRLPHAEWNYTP